MLLLTIKARWRPGTDQTDGLYEVLVKLKEGGFSQSNLKCDCETVEVCGRFDHDNQLDAQMVLRNLGELQVLQQLESQGCLVYSWCSSR